MATLSEDRSFALKCRKSAPRVTVYQVKLTESALKAVHSLKDRNTNGPSLQPTIQFNGPQGSIRLPHSDSETQTFNFYLSNVTKDNPQGSFECLQQLARSGAPGLSVLGPVQSKISLCDTNESNHVTKLRAAPAVGVSKERGPNRVKKTAIRKPRPSTADVVPERKRSTPLNPANTIRKCLTSNPVSQRSLRDRILHLLALRNYKKLELLARLQRDGLSQKDRASLGSTLSQVAVLNPKENSFSLRDFLFREVQKDWPGFTEEERSVAQRNTARKLGQSSEESSSSPKDSAPCLSPQRLQEPDRDFIDPLAPKRHRISHLSHRAEERRPTSAPSTSSSPSSSALTSSSSSAPSHSLSSAPRAVPRELSPSSAPFHPSAPSHSPSTPEGCGTQDLPQDQSLSCRDPHLSPSPRSSSRKAKKKSKKHRERDRSPPGGEEKKRRNEDTTIHRQTDYSERNIADFLLKYHPLVSVEQRQQYKDDFNSEYEEYRSLHAHVESVTRRFSQLERSCRSLTPGSTEHQRVQEQVVREYKMIQQNNPRFQEQKQRCEYLHNKLAHIKRLISDFDQKRAQRWS